MENNNINNFKLNKYELDVIKNIEEFRKDPESFKKKITTLAKTFKGEYASHGEHLLKEIEHLNLYKGENLYLISNKLCKAAKEILEKNISESNDQLRVIKSYVDNISNNEFFCLIEKDKDDIRTQFFFARINEGDESEKIGKFALQSKEINFIGISGDENNRCIIFSKKAEENALVNYLEYSQLIESFNRFDIDKNGYLIVKDVIKNMMKLNYQLRYPLMFNIISKCRGEILTFEDFMDSLINFNETASQKSSIEHTLRQIFNFENNNNKIELKTLSEKYELLDQKELCNVFKKIVDENHDKTHIEIETIIKYFLI